MNSRIQDWLRWILIGLFFLWVVLVLSTYYNVQFSYLELILVRLGQQDWITPTFSLQTAGNVILDILVAAWISLIALGVGRYFLHKLKLTDLSLLDEGLIGLAIGFGLLGLLVLLMGLVGLLGTTISLVLMFLLSALTVRSTTDFMRRIHFPGVKVIIFLFVFLTLLLALTLALLPPTDWDGLFYHLKGPQLYLETGRIVANLDIPHLNFPSSFEMLFLLAMSLRGDTTAVLLHYVFALMLTGLVFSMARRLFHLANPWLAVLFLLAIPMVLGLSGWAYNDLALAFYEITALYLLLLWHARQNRLNHQGSDDSIDVPGGGDVKAGERVSMALLGLSGLFAGFSMGLKYTSFVVPLTLMALIFCWQRRKLAVLFRSLLLFGAIAFLAAAPWYLKNLVFTGNPFYPFVFAGENWDDFRADTYRRSGSGIAYNPERCLPFENDNLVTGLAPDCDLDLSYFAGRLVRLPYDITLGLQDASGDGNTGPLFLLFFPLILIYAAFRRGSERPSALNAMLFFVLAQFAFWTLGVVSTSVLFQTRLLLPALVALCPILAWILEDLARYDQPRFSFRGQLIVILTLVLLTGLALQIIYWLPSQPWAYLSGAEDRDAYLQRNLGSHYLAMETINDQLPDDAVVAFFWEPRSYYCRVDCFPDSILDSFGRLEYLYDDAEGIRRALLDQGVSHILIFEAGLDFVLNNNLWQDEPLLEPANLTTMRKKYLEEIDTFGVDTYKLFEIETP
jgi:4-amino-4-deoxy-L-arabinose transferase-like glycosyltransferase